MGERGLISYFEKENLLKDLNKQQILLTQQVKTIENQNCLEKVRYILQTLFHKEFGARGSKNKDVQGCPMWLTHSK